MNRFIFFGVTLLQLVYAWIIEWVFISFGIVGYVGLSGEPTTKSVERYIYTYNATSYYDTEKDSIFYSFNDTIYKDIMIHNATFAQVQTLITTKIVQPLQTYSICMCIANGLPMLCITGFLLVWAIQDKKTLPFYYIPIIVIIDAIGTYTILFYGVSLPKEAIATTHLLQYIFPLPSYLVIACIIGFVFKFGIFLISGEGGRQIENYILSHLKLEITNDDDKNPLVETDC